MKLEDALDRAEKWSKRQNQPQYVYQANPDDWQFSPSRLRADQTGRPYKQVWFKIVSDSADPVSAAIIDQINL